MCVYERGWKGGKEGLKISYKSFSRISQVLERTLIEHTRALGTVKTPTERPLYLLFFDKMSLIRVVYLGINFQIS